MSILLNALKKSEAQRQLGETPGIHTTVETPSTGSASDQQWIPLFMLMLSAFAIAWFGWQQYREPPQLLTAPQLAAKSPEAATEPAIESATRTVVESYAAGEDAAPGPTRVAASSQQESEQHRQTLNESFNDYESETAPGADENAPSPQVALAETMPGPNVNDSISAEESPTVPEDEQRQRRASRVEPRVAEPISFWQLPQALRDGLPEFRVNVLVYAEAPEDRFVLINGMRLVEKQELASGVVLDEIRRDGLVFLYRNYRFLVRG